MQITRDDIAAGHVLPRLIENSVWVPPSLRINCSTLREHQERLKRSERLSDEEIARLYPGSFLPPAPMSEA